MSGDNKMSCQKPNRLIDGAVLLILITNNGIWLLPRSQASPIFLVLSFAFSKTQQKQKNGEDLEHLSHDGDAGWM